MKNVDKRIFDIKLYGYKTYNEGKISMELLTHWMKRLNRIHHAAYKKKDDNVSENDIESDEEEFNSKTSGPFW